MKNLNPVRIVIADDQPLIRSGLSGFLMVFDELQLVGEAENGEEIIQLCELIEPDVAIIDLEMPHIDGLTATRTIHQRWPQIKVIITNDSSEDERIKKTLQAGAVSFLSKDMCADDLAKAIRNAVAEEPHQPENHQHPETVITETADVGAVTSTRPNLEQELITAGKIQADILPASAPTIFGWDFAARLLPARETSGDFFDFIPLPNGNWGIVIADVTDKGMGAALFMTLCSTLMRTYATHYPTLPAIVFSTVNDRILADTRGDLFVTAFYGVLEPDTGRMRYVNAGHNPPFLISCKKGKPVDSLRPTGMALGVMEDAHWGQKIAKFRPGDTMILYTDGVTEAQDKNERFFGEERLLQIAKARQGSPSSDIRDAILRETDRFHSSAYPNDDIALIVIARK